jgi:Trypsin-like peptidase domain/Family of unknown function (DUF6263)
MIFTTEGANSKAGTGWLIDRSQKLLVTNHHVVGHNNDVFVIFPAYKNGEVIPELSHYIKNGQRVRGKVIDSDPQRDLAVVQLESVPQEARELKLAAKSPSPMERVHSVGNPEASDALWIYTEGPVRQVYRKKFRYQDGQGIDAVVVETQSPVNHGDSGGPVVNDKGELVAVVSGFNVKARSVSYFIDVSEVRTVIAEARIWLGSPMAKADPTGSRRSRKAESIFTAFFESAPPFFQVVETKTSQFMRLQGQNVRQKQDQTFYVKWTPKEQDKDGNYVVEQSVVGIKIDFDMGGNEITFDSTRAPGKQPKNNMTDFFNALMEQSLTFTITPAMEVKSIGGRDKIIKSLAEANPSIKTLLEIIMSEEACKKMAEPTWFAVPTADKTWTRDSKLELGPIGTYDTHCIFTNEGTKVGKDTIRIEAEMKYSPPTQKQGLPFTIKSADFKSISGRGIAVFDRNKGRLESSTIKMKLEGKLMIQVGNEETEIDLKQDTTSRTRSYDSNPLHLAE